VETRGGDKRPILSDLRESGAIEQDADIVGFLYRPEYYGLLQDEDGSSNQGVGEVIIAKHRNGALERVRLRFVGQYARFENFEDTFDSGGGGDFQPSALNAGMSVNHDFDAPRTTTLSSRMNSLEDEDFTLGDSTPF
jgi:replicative DNA helicase